MNLYKALHPESPVVLYFPRRQINIRRRGVITSETQAIFPGYVFVELESDDAITNYHWTFRKTDGFYRFLKSNQNICPLEKADLEIVLHFIKKIGPIAGASKAYLDENSRIVVTEGPLMGLEGKVIKVDKRKGRAKIKLDLYNDSFSIDMAIEFIGAAPRPSRQGTG